MEGYPYTLNSVITVNVYSLYFSAIFTNGNDFRDFPFTMFTFLLSEKAFPIWGLLLKKQICSFPFRVNPTEMGGKTENVLVAFLDSEYAIHLKRRRFRRYVQPNFGVMCSRLN